VGAKQWAWRESAATGLFWCLTLRRTGNLCCCGGHACQPFRFGENIFCYSVPDSGYIFPGHFPKTRRSPARVADRRKRRAGSLRVDLHQLLSSFLYVFQRLSPAPHSDSRLPGRSYADPNSPCWLGARSVTPWRALWNFLQGNSRASNPFADTFAPARSRWPSAGELGIPTRVARGIGIILFGRAAGIARNSCNLH